MNFLITSHGRTATKWLAGLLNRSDRCTVLHEPTGNKDNIAFNSKQMRELSGVPDHIQARFVADYGEVNSVMKYYIFDLDVYTRAYIWREPREVILSFANRKHWRDNILYKIEEINYFEHRFFNAPLMEISHRRMTTDIEYAQFIADYFVGDVVVTAQDLIKRVNVNGNKVYKSWGDLPIDVIEFYESLDWPHD